MVASADSMNHTTLSRAIAILNKVSEWLVLLWLVVACVPPVLVRHESLAIVPKLSPTDWIDFSWLLDTSYKAAGGIWFGRDVVFTYGPAFQWLSSAPARWIGVSIGSVYATWYTLPLLTVVLATSLTVRLLLPHAAAWRRALLLLLAVVFWSPPDVRVSICLLGFAIFVRVTDSAVERQDLVLDAMVSAAICVGAFWISADTGLYTAAALLLCIVATAATKHRVRRMGLFALLAAVSSAVLALVTSAVLAPVFNFGFWRSSLAIAADYRWFEPSAMTKPDKYRILAMLALGIVAVFLTWRQRSPGARFKRAFLLAGFALGFLMLQSALVRSDHGHVLVGLYAMIFFCGTIALTNFESQLISNMLPAVAVLGTLSLASSYAPFRPGEILHRWHEIRQPVLNCPAGSAEFDHACFAATDAEMLGRISAYIGAHTAPGDQIAVFPYQTAFGLASRRQVAGGVLQSYLVNGEYLTGVELAGLRRSQPTAALYFPDGVTSVPVDSVPNLTRSPDLWLYLLRHYRLDESPATGALSLVRDDARQGRLGFREQKIANSTGPVAISKRSTVIDLGPIDWPSGGANFLKLRLQLDYPPWWGLRKPSKLTLLMSFASGKQKPVEFVLQPGRTGEIWIYPWDDAAMAAYFADDWQHWPSTGGAGLTGLKLLITPFDWISAMPKSVVIESVEAVRMDLRSR